MLIVTGWMVKHNEKIDGWQMFVTLIIVVLLLPLIMIISLVGKLLARDK